MTEDEIAEQHHRLDGCEFELRELVMDREAGVLQFMGSKESDTTELLN